MQSSIVWQHTLTLIIGAWPVAGFCICVGRSRGVSIVTSASNAGGLLFDPIRDRVCLFKDSIVNTDVKRRARLCRNTSTFMDLTKTVTRLFEFE
uniref:Secreted protein n=1 Tax=Ascaris lumbricoides TaxID=6252 RepID=A0A0M3HF21_ASCLU